MAKPPKPPGKPDKPPTDQPPVEPPPVDPPSSGPIIRRLITDCMLPNSAPTEGQPFELDACMINDGDDITQLLTDIQKQWPGGFYVRAPSHPLNVVCNTIKWPSETKTYVFLENAPLLIQHAPNPADFWTMWRFDNFDTVKIGGPNLSLTFKGNHPGLANGGNGVDDANQGLIEFRMSDGTMAKLADVRANIRFSQQYSIYTWGGIGEGDMVDKIEHFNVSGLHYATSGVFFHQGVKHAWSDPNNFKVSDPYVRGIGWTGIAPGAMQGGLPLGCNDQTKDQVRFSSFAGYYTDSITGGMTVEYGAANWVQRFTGRVGNSAADPYVVRIKDWYVSGPGTPYPAGVRVKKTVDANFFKGDPHDRPEDNGSMRFVRFVKLKDDYGSGPGFDYLEGCTPSCAYMDGPSNVFRLENSTTRDNRGWHIILDGDWDTNFLRGDLFYFAFDNSPIYGNTLEAAAGTTITDTIIMCDRNTVTGSGTFSDICVANHSPATPGRDNLISGTTIAGVVDIAENTGTTTIENVAFSGEARTIITIGAGSTVKASGLLARAGSTVDGAGTLIYNSVETTLPYTF